MEFQEVTLTPTRYREIQKYCPRDHVVLLQTHDGERVRGDNLAAPPTPGVYVQRSGKTIAGDVIPLSSVKGYAYIPVADWEAMMRTAE